MHSRMSMLPAIAIAGMLASLFIVVLRGLSG
jgi:hypothetical protein